MPIDKSITLSIEPAHSIGPFKLGQSLYQSIQIILKKKLKLKIVANFERVSNVPIIIILEQYGLKLYYNQINQILIAIEVYRFDKCVYQRNGDPVNADFKLPNFYKIYNKIFGPTYTGIIDEDKSYALSYEGISFKFDMKKYRAASASAGGAGEGSSNSAKLVQFINDNSQRIYCHCIFVSKSNSIAQFHSNLKEILSDNHNNTTNGNSSKKRFKSAEVDLKKRSIRFTSSPSGKGRNNEDNKDDVINLKLGESTMNEMMFSIGAPDDTYLNGSDKYFNYFRYGFDLCCDVSKPGTIINKINIHSNLINSFEFMKYEKLEWNVNFGHGHGQGDGDDKDKILHHSTKFKEFEPFLKDKLSQPIFLNRNEYDLINSLHKRFESLNTKSNNSSGSSNSSDISTTSGKSIASTTSNSSSNSTTSARAITASGAGVNNNPDFELIDYEDLEVLVPQMDEDVIEAQPAQLAEQPAQAAGAVVQPETTVEAKDIENDTSKEMKTEQEQVPKAQVQVQTQTKGPATAQKKDRLNDWGLTNLYCYENIIFEVMIDNDDISMISIV